MQFNFSPVALRLRRTTALAVSASMAMAPLCQAFAAEEHYRTATPIKHVIMIIGENHTFDNLFATYQPKNGTVSNLLSKQIVTVDGTPGKNFASVAQSNATDTGEYAVAPSSKTAYSVLPPSMTGGTPSAASDTNGPPFATLAFAQYVNNLAGNEQNTAGTKLLLTGASGEPSYSIDYRIDNAAAPANGPYQITGKNMPYDTYQSSPVHRFYQMWQQTDCSAAHVTKQNSSGCLNDLFPWVETTIGAGSNGKPQPANFTNQTTGEGSTAMGFFNVAKGDVPYLKQLADTYTMSDNFHQSIEGGTGANHIAIGTGLAIYYSDSEGKPATPPVSNIENPTPQAGTNNYYAQDGYSGGSYSNCSDPTQPGVKSVLSYLSTLSYRPASKCAANAYYLLNNYNPGYFGDGTVNTQPYTIPPSTVPTIGDSLNAKNISWRYYGAGWDAYVQNPAIPLYCNICNPFQYETAIMADPAQRKAHISDIPELDSDIKNGTLPAVSIIKPSGVSDGHPASSKLDVFEAFTQRIIGEIKANPELWKTTAILITMDEGGGYWDSGYIQPLDFFGDGTRIPAIMVSPYSAAIKISHTYTDHVSFLKFIDKNWDLKPVSTTSRDNLPNPQALTDNPYVPVNSPAIGDLMDMFDFTKPPQL